jgi:acetyl esterase/lipase
MNIIYTASRKERVHVEQIIREQPILPHECVDISTVAVSKRMGLSMNIYKQSIGFKGPRPIIIDVHGGGLIAGRKEQNQNLCLTLAQHGYLTFAPDYRLVPETDIFGQISDVLEAISMVADIAPTYGGDLNNVFVVADSAGAFLASMAIATMHNPNEMRPVIHRLDRKSVPQNIQDLRVGAMGFQSGMFYIYKGQVGLLANSYMEKRWRKQDYAAIIRPENYCKLLPQCFVCSGKDDFIKAQTKQFVKLLKANGRSYRYVFCDDKGSDHAYAALHPETEWGEMANDKMLAFFDRCKR